MNARPRCRTRAGASALLAAGAAARLGAGDRRAARSSPSLLSSVRDHVGLPTVLLLFLLVVVGAAALGGHRARRWSPRSAASLLRELVLHAADPHAGRSTTETTSWRSSSSSSSRCRESWFVATVARRSADAARARAEAETLAAARWRRSSPTRSARPSSSTCATRLRPRRRRRARPTNGPAGRSRRRRATDAAVDPSDATTVVDARATASCWCSAGDDLARRGPARAERVRAASSAAALESRRLASEAVDRGARWPKANELRTALLAGRVPRPAHAARVDQGVGDEPAAERRRSWTPRRPREFLETIDDETDRLNALVGNLLDMSRLADRRARASDRAPVGLEEVVPAALAQPRRAARRRRASTSPRRCRASHADPALLERARREPRRQRPRVVAAASRPSGSRPAPSTIASTCGSIDRGPGIPAATIASACSSRSSGSATDPNGAGVGLGLAVAQGLRRGHGRRARRRRHAGRRHDDGRQRRAGRREARRR